MDMLSILFQALDISAKAAIIIMGVIYYYDRKATKRDIEKSNEEFNAFKDETERQIEAIWNKVDLKLGNEIPSYFREIKEMWHASDKLISNQKIQFENLNSKVDGLSKRQDTLIANTLETLAGITRGLGK